jgi:hypothetical protein
MARALMRVVLVVVVLIGSALLPRSGAVSADNSRDAARVLVCTWSYHGVDQREEIADLDRTVTQPGIALSWWQSLPLERERSDHEPALSG